METICYFSISHSIGTDLGYPRRGRLSAGGLKIEHYKFSFAKLDMIVPAIDELNEIVTHGKSLIAFDKIRNQQKSDRRIGPSYLHHPVNYAHGGRLAADSLQVLNRVCDKR